MINPKDIVTISFSKVEKYKERCMIIAKKKLSFTYNRYGYSEKERLNKIYQGELAQCALKIFFNQENIIYEDYDSIRKDNYELPDPWDFRIKTTEGVWLQVDIKSSQNRYNYNVSQLLSNNFTVPVDQEIKDLTIQIFINELSKEFIIMGFIKREELKKAENRGFLNKIKKEYYKKQICFGMPMAELGKL